MISAAELSGLNLSGQVVNGVRVIKMTAQRFVYDPNTIVVKKGEPVRLEITSMDVTHGFAIEAFNIDRKLKPRETEIIEFTPRQTGKFEFYCTVYCGKGHANMRGYMYVKD
jgi:nitrosocyanin